MTSFRQIQANRRNALKSTGPSSEEGKTAIPPQCRTPRPHIAKFIRSGKRRSGGRPIAIAHSLWTASRNGSVMAQPG